MTEPERRIVVEWEDPALLAERAAQMSGLDFLRAMIAGELPQPPIAKLLGFALVEAAEGSAAFEAVPGERHYNPIGVVHAGLAATMLDSVTGVAVHTTLPKGGAYTTLETKFNLVRPISSETGRIRAEATVLHRGRSVATAEGRLADERGKLLAHATTTCMVFESGR